MTSREKRQRVARAVKFARQIGTHARRRRLPRQQYPFMIEVEYAKRLIQMIDAARAGIAPLMHDLAQLRSAAERRDSPEADRVHAIIQHVKDAALTRPQLETVIVAFAQRIATHQRREFAKQVKAGLGVDVQQLGIAVHVTGRKLANFVAENVALIKSLPVTPLDEVERLVTRGFASGARHETMAQEIEQRFEVARSRARLIARDQVGKLNAQMARDSNYEIGVDRWRWRSMRDKAVRPEHQHYDQASQRVPYSYSGQNGPQPPTMPGREVQCRCYDEPVLEDILDELEAV